MIKTIGIIGHTGVVGSAMFRYYRKKRSMKVLGHSKDLRDKYPNSPIKKIQDTDVIFIAVPTPYKRGQKGHDLSILHSILRRLPKNKLVVIRSTLVPETTNSLQTKYPHLRILYNPEFLSEKTADNDFAYPDKQIIGYTNQTKQYATDILNILPKAKYVATIPATEAEIVKYTSTLYAGLKIAFANQLYDLCEKTQANYSTVLSAFAASKWLKTDQETSYMKIFDKGYRGYAGHCFPKDIAALLQFAKSKNLKFDLFHAMKKTNNNLLKNNVLH